MQTQEHVPSDHSAKVYEEHFGKPPLIKRALRVVAPVKARYRVRQWLIDTPGVSEAYTKADKPLSLTRVTRDTQLVLDGFPRSANSYARSAFMRANGDDLRICAHFHSHRAIQLGAKYGLPTIALVREPRAVVASSLQYATPVPAIYGVKAYIRYYEHVLPLVDRVLVADFRDVTADFGAVITRCNERFGTDFVPYERTPENEAAVAARIDEWATVLMGDYEIESVAGRPSEVRRSADEMIDELDAPTKRALDRASALYARLTEAASKHR